MSNYLKSKVYALYEYDELICIGTIRQIAKYTGLNKESIKFYSTPTYARRNIGKEPRKILVFLDDYEYEES